MEDKGYFSKVFSKVCWFLWCHVWADREWSPMIENGIALPGREGENREVFFFFKAFLHF